MKELEKLLKLGSDYKVEKQGEVKENNKTIKLIYVSCRKKKEKCPKCGCYTSSIHDKLRPVELKYLKIVEYDVKIVITKRRFICYKCNKRFTERVDINNNRCNISNKLKQKVLKDLLNYNLSLKYIAKKNNISEDSVRTILEEAMDGYPTHIKKLPKIISMDEFKADTREGKYAYILTDPIHKKVLDVLPNRKKEDLIRYLTKVQNRSSV